MIRSLLACTWLVSLGAALSAAPLNQLTPEERAAGWILLFDGETTFGWEAASQADWQVVDGALRVTRGEKGLLVTTSEFADYRLLVDFRAPTTTNSGVFLRTPPIPRGADVDCYELNIADPSGSPFPTGSFVQRAKASSYRPSDQWQTFDVTCRGGQFTVLLDGQKVLEYSDGQPIPRGRIGLQLNSGRCEFRNIKLLPLGLEPLFNGRDLTGWREPPAEEQKSVFSVNDRGELNVKNGRGQLESVAEFGNFVLQLEVFSNGKHLNSGVFFRSIPRDIMNGYELQIHNGFKDDDRSQPIDCGTGGFYRRQNARRVVSNDFEWTQLTLVVHGPHMAAWVNGIQVSDWTDDRPEDANPRKGLRTAPGTLILQGHDPTTDLSFRGFRAAEMK